MSIPADASSSIRYRAHIDGLRGISIIMMILFHAGFPGDTGGFIGVDIFFVISGFLITSIIARDIQNGTFSLVKFWERRIRRIIPPLVIVMTCTAIAGYLFLLYPKDYHHLGNAITAQSLFVSNGLFALTDNYFDKSSQFSPLLHTWTLSLEEQFYLVYPFIILLSIYAWRKWFRDRHLPLPWQKILLWVVSILGLASFVTSIWFVNISPSSGLELPFVPHNVLWQTSLATAGFYLIPSRAWEIACGIILALTAFKIRSKVVAEIASAAGLLFIFSAVIFLNDGMPFPGLFALLPTIGTLLVITANEQHETITGKALSFPILIGLGLISYSLYLWYWPLFVFTHVLTLFSPSHLQIAAAMSIAVVLAWLSYMFVETPIRKKRIFKSAKSVYIAGIGSMIVLAGVGQFMLRTAYAQTDRIPVAAQKIVQPAETGGSGKDCFSSESDTGSFASTCRIGNREEDRGLSFVVWGDSQADAVTPLFDELAKSAHVQGAVFYGGACVPVLGVHQSPPATGCEDVKTLAMRYIEANDIKNVFLVARWGYYVMGGPDHARVAFITDSKQISTRSEDAEAALQRTLIPMVQRMVNDGRHVYIIKQAPEQLSFNTHTAFYTVLQTGKDIAMTPASRQENAAYQARANSVIDQLASTTGITIIDPNSILCTEDACPLEKGGTLLYRDESHVSDAGALLLKPLFVPLFRSLVKATH